MPDKSLSTPTGNIITKTPKLTLLELCERCDVSEDLVTTYVSEGIIEPQGAVKTQWRFSRIALVEVHRAKRLEHDLGLNAAGVALALDLMGQIEELKRRLAQFTRDDRTGNNQG